MALSMPLVRPPGPEPVTYHPASLLGHFGASGRDPTEMIARRFERYGDLYHLRFLGRDVYVTRHPEHIQQILITQAERFAKPRGGIVARQLRRLLGEGLLLSDGERWRRQRRLIQPAFRRERVDQYMELAIDLAEQFAASLGEGQRLDVSRAMMELTLRIVSRALFDHDAASDTDRVARATRAFRAAFGGLGMLLPAWLPTRRNHRIERALVDLDALVYDLIDRAACAPAGIGQAAGRPDLLRALTGAVDSEGDGEGMDRKQLRDELVTLLLAGHETTAHALSWTFHLLAQHPDVEATLREEAVSVLGERRPTPADVDKLHYTEQVLSEAMRLYPPAYSLARVTTEEAEIDGFVVPRDADVVIWIYHVQRDPRWFPEPARFDPGRFSPARRGAIRPFSYLPFGAGTRTCIGKHFALMEAKLVLACTVRRASFAALGSGRVQRDLAVTLAPKGGLPMRVQVF